MNIFHFYQIEVNKLPLTNYHLFINLDKYSFLSNVSSRHKEQRSIFVFR